MDVSERRAGTDVSERRAGTEACGYRIGFDVLPGVEAGYIGLKKQFLGRALVVKLVDTQA